MTLLQPRRVAVLAFCAICLLLPGGWAAPAGAARQPLDPVDQLGHDLVAFTRLPGVRHGVWGIAVHSLARDERLFELNPDTRLVPASIAKLVSAASAVDAVGWDHRYETTIRTTAPIVNGVLRGDLIVAGSGDPSIGGRGGIPLAGWIDTLRAAGLRRIEGRIVADDDALEEPRPALAWAWDDLGYPTGAIFGALNLAENRIAVTVTAGVTEGGPTAVRVEPDATHRPLANRTVTGPRGSAAGLWPEQRPGEEMLTIAGTIPAGARPLTLLVSAGNPTLWFATALRHLLIRSGIDVTGSAYDADDLTPRPESAAAHVLVTHTSPPLRSIVQPLLKDSINLYGEAFLRLNVPPGMFPTNDAALEALAERLTAWGVRPEARHLVDGSGLSRRNLLAADALIPLLARMHDTPGGSPFVAALPVAGIDGTLASRMRGTTAAGNVRAKTGTMTTVRSLAGYVTTRDGEPLAFVVMVNNFEGTGASAAQAVDAIAIRLADFSRAAGGR